MDCLFTAEVEPSLVVSVLEGLDQVLGNLAVFVPSVLAAWEAVVRERLAWGLGHIPAAWVLGPAEPAVQAFVTVEGVGLLRMKSVVDTPPWNRKQY